MTINPYLKALYSYKERGRTYLKCKCVCGNEVAVRADNAAKRKESCGCVEKKTVWRPANQLKPLTPEQDITGKNKNKLTAIEFLGRDGGRAIWLFKCDCGNSTKVSASNFLNDGVKSCGCGRAEANRERSIYSTPEEARFQDRLRRYKDSADERRVSWELSDSICRTLFAMPCIYCDSPPSNTSRPDNNPFEYNGIDRVDNKCGYVLENCIPCCHPCNRSKSDESVAFFQAWCQQVMAMADRWHRRFQMDELVSMLETLRLQPNDRQSIVITEYKPTRKAHNKKYENAADVLLAYVIRDVEKHAEERSLDFELSENECRNLIWSRCFYCDVACSNNQVHRGQKMFYNGIDRVDSRIGYKPENCVPCCIWCNRSKSDQSVDEFYLYIEILVSRIPFEPRVQDFLKKQINQ